LTLDEMLRVAQGTDGYEGELDLRSLLAELPPKHPFSRE
jgi:hypothetical protein